MQGVFKRVYFWLNIKKRLFNILNASICDWYDSDFTLENDNALKKLSLCFGSFLFLGLLYWQLCFIIPSIDEI